MRERVIPDDMPSLGDFPRDVASLADVAADEKKCGANVMLRQNFQQTKGVRVVGTVVIGQRKLSGARGESGERATVPLTSRSHRLIAGCNGSADSNSSSSERNEHRTD